MLEIQNITKSYGKFVALDGISAKFEPGILGLLGPNGAGKSTLMNILTRNLDADSGTILWQGTTIEKLGVSYRSLLGFMPQQQGLYDGFTGFAFLNYLAVLKAVPGRKIREEILRAAEKTNMTSRLKDKISSYSGGMKQRILLASAVLGNPSLIILDEPTAGLDPKERIRTRELIQSVAGDKIVIVATHVVSDVESIADEIVLMRQGKIVQKDKTDAICERYGNGHGLEGVYLHCFSDGTRQEGEAWD
ncbi:MAG: ATP-binding cassette domain-containing protein [Clostridiales bacterium]|jgi:ABC-type multidrug transport system ATPase subunit|nr:ATP-binding cassette domain-containing protein [Clostridiales bacterium]